MHSQNNPRKTGNIPDTITYNHGLILKEVVVKASPKIIVKRDTVSFSADAFMNNSEKVVEDLLKKLPGIDVGKDGTVMVNGKRVERILIEGDDIFKKDYSVLSRNLSAAMIDKVQVIDNYTDNKLLKGLVSSGQKVINLTLKNKQQKMLFGTISAGAGTDNRQDISANLISFMSKAKIYCLGSYNTTGRDLAPAIAGQDGADVMNNNSTSNTTNINLLNIYRQYKTEAGSEKISFNKAGLFSSFVSHNPCPNLTVRFSGWSFFDNNTLAQENSYRYYLKDSIININEHNRYSGRPVSTAGNIEIGYQCAKNAALRLSSSFFNTAALATADMASNGTLYYNKLQENSIQLNNVLTYTRRVNDDNALVIEAAFMRHREKQYLSVRQSPARHLPFSGLPADALYQSVSSPFDEASLFFHYISTKRSWRMNVDVDAIWHSRHLHSSLDTLSFTKEARQGLDSFLNNGQLRRFTSGASFTLSRQIKGLQLSASLAGHFLYNGSALPGNGYSGPNVIRLYPSFRTGIKRKIANQTFSVDYSYDIKFPGITDLYEGYLLSDYRSLQKGIGLFSDRPMHTVLLGYTYVCLPKQLLLYTAVSYIIVNGVPVSDLRLTANYDIMTQTSALSGMASSLYSIGIDKFINILNAGLKLKTTVSANRYRDVLGGVGGRKIKSMGSITQLSLRSTFRGLFNYNAGIISNYSKSRIVNRPEFLFQNHMLTPFLDLHFKFPEKLRVIINNEAINTNRKYCCFTDLSLQYELMRSKASFVLTGRNLLNNKKYLYMQIDDHSIQIQQYDLRPLYVLLQLNYRF